jgi:hypothetical protein
MLGRKVKTLRTNSSEEREQTNIESIIKDLESIRRKLKKARGGYYEEVYSEMASALPIALLLRSNKRLKRKFLSEVESKRGSGGVPINIVTEVMVYVMDASSESRRKLAWRRGRVIEFLHDQGVKIGKVAAEIKARGGISAVLKQATEKDPRREKVPADAKNVAKKSKPLVVKTRDEEDRDTSGSDESDVTPARSAEGSRRNDGQVIMPVLITLSDRDMLFDLPVKSRVKIYATRGSQKQAKIEVSNVKKLKPDVSKPEEDDTWE